MDSLEEETLSSHSLDACISNVGGGVNRVEVLMPHQVLSGEDMQANQQTREHAKDYI